MIMRRYNAFYAGIIFPVKPGHSHASRKSSCLYLDVDPVRTLSVGSIAFDLRFGCAAGGRWCVRTVLRVQWLPHARLAGNITCSRRQRWHMLVPELA